MEAPRSEPCPSAVLAARRLCPATVASHRIQLTTVSRLTRSACWNNSAVATIVSQLPALIGVALGVFGTLLVTAVSDRARWKRDHTVRWDERRLEAYADYARAIKEMYTAALHMSEHRFHADKIEQIDLETGRKLLERANSNRTIKWEAMLLLGDSAAVAAGRAWRDAVYDVASFSLNTDAPRTYDDWRSLIEIVDDARDKFYAAARGSLDVRGSVEQAPWRSWRSQ
jgi:hypothetical protein